MPPTAQLKASRWRGQDWKLTVNFQGERLNPDCTCKRKDVENRPCCSCPSAGQWLLLLGSPLPPQNSLSCTHPTLFLGSGSSRQPGFPGLWRCTVSNPQPFSCLQQSATAAPVCPSSTSLCFYMLKDCCVSSSAWSFFPSDIYPVSERFVCFPVLSKGGIVVQWMPERLEAERNQRVVFLTCDTPLSFIQN